MDRTLISILGGLGGMIGWGTSDFLANDASEKIGHTRALFWSQLVGLSFIAIIVLLTQASFSISLFLLFLSVVGGVVYALGYIFFYKGFEIGNVSVISAVSNLNVLFVILISFFIRGQMLTSFQLPAIALLLIGVTLVSLNLKELRKGVISLLAGVKETMIASIMFGVFYWPLNEYIVERADWLVISFITKFVAILFTFLFIKLKNKENVTIHKKTKRLFILLLAVGLLEAGAVLSVTFGQSFGDGIIVAPISSALTVVTVFLAMIFTKERINKVQALGITLAVGGIILTAF